MHEDLIVHEEEGAELEAAIPLGPQRAPGGMVALHQPGKGHPFSWSARPPEGEGEVQGGHQAWEAEVAAVEVRREKAAVFHSNPWPPEGFRGVLCYFAMKMGMPGNM